jgi:hypothetical protein
VTISRKYCDRTPVHISTPKNGQMIGWWLHGSSHVGSTDTVFYMLASSQWSFCYYILLLGDT